MKILALDIATKTGWKTETSSGVWDLTTAKGVYVLGIDESKRCDDGYFYYVYCTVNLKTGSIYIGKRTSKTLKDSYIGSGTALKDAIKKYGVCSFGKHILEYTTSQKLLHQLELFYIDIYNAQNSDCCYNLIRDSGKPNYKKEMSESTKMKLREINKGKKLSEKTKMLISKSSKMRKHTKQSKEKLSEKHKGKVISDKQREDISNTLKIKWQNASFRKRMTDINRINLRKVYQYNLNGNLEREYDSVADAKRETGFKNIYSIFNNNRIYGYGFYWSYDRKHNFLKN